MNNKILLQSSVVKDDITESISKLFDYEFDGQISEEIIYPEFPKEFNIGIIVGSSGSGKSTIAKKLFGDEQIIQWDNTKSIASHFDSAQSASNMFGAVGLNSIPTWLKPYNVLSTGEKFRADMARKLKSYAVIDEFTSVVHRDVAKSCAVSISKYIKKNNIHNVVFCSCHDDIIEFLEPDWIYNTDTKQLIRGSVRQSSFVISINGCTKEAWNLFKKYHYLSADLNKSSDCYIGQLNNRPIAFGAVICQPCVLKHAYREHRIVVLPDFQGMGIGNKFSESIGQAYVNAGCRYISKTANPRMGIHRDNSSLWRQTSHNHSDRTDMLKSTFTSNKSIYFRTDDVVNVYAKRVCYAHEYIGDGTTYPYTYKTISEIKNNQNRFKLL